MYAHGEPGLPAAPAQERKAPSQEQYGATESNSFVLMASITTVALAIVAAAFCLGMLFASKSMSQTVVVEVKEKEFVREVRKMSSETEEEEEKQMHEDAIPRKREKQKEKAQVFIVTDYGEKIHVNRWCKSLKECRRVTEIRSDCDLSNIRGGDLLSVNKEEKRVSKIENAKSQEAKMKVCKLCWNMRKEFCEP